VTAQPWTVAEVTLLRAVLRAPALLDVVRLDKDHFSADSHQVIWTACTHLHKQGRPVLPPAVRVFLGGVLAEQPEKLAEAVAYVDRLYARGGDTDTDLALEMAGRIRAYATVRAVREAANTLAATAAADDLRALDLARDLAGLVAENDDMAPTRGWEKVAGETMDDMWAARDAAVPVLPVPFGRLREEQTFAPGALVMLAARTNMGKSALALRFSAHAAKEGKTVLHVSLEMRDKQLARRALSAATGVPATTLKNGILTESEWARLWAGMNAMQDWRLFVMDRGRMDLEAITARARRHKHTTGLDLLVVDYIQRMPLPLGRNVAKHDAVGMVSGALKALATELECPVLCLAQLSREGDMRDGRRPTLTNLKDSGDLEQDADTVLLLSPELAERQTLAEWTALPVRPMLLDVAKSRDGATFDMRLAFHAPTVHFSEA